MNEVVRVDRNWYDRLVEDIKDLEYTGIVITKHAIGKRILQDELKFGKPEYGTKKIEGLAKDLDVSGREVYRCIQFARKYPEIDTVCQYSWRKITGLLQEPREEKEPIPLPEGKYSVIYADPPWKYHIGDQHSKEEQETVLGSHYQSMSIEELCELQIPAAENAVLFMWATSPLVMSQEAFQVVTAWGFEAKSCFVWDKVKHNVGHYNSVRHEFLIIAIKGSYPLQNRQLYDSVQTIERTKHSEKPEKFRKIISNLYPNGKRIELFARKKTDGWDTYGDDPVLQGEIS
jgi:N6-adenosine-specific RNA methylase IME4